MDSRSLGQWLERLERLHPKAMELGLQRVSAVARTLGLLPVKQPVITVAGTNGKGSTVAVLEALLAELGLRTGAFTSPHLLRFNERIRVGCVDSSDDEIVAAFEAIDAARGEITLTYFEFAALAALQVFQHRDVEVLILEVGLGGRLDAVNIVDASVAVITSIDLDHQAWLGDSRASIAIEKAGILRSGRPAVIADPAPPAQLLAYAANSGATPVLYNGTDFHVDTGSDAGQWQGILCAPQGAQLQRRRLPPQPRGALLPANICAALQAVLLLGRDFSDEQLGRALAVARPRARRELFCAQGRQYVLDVAHNPASVDKLIEYLDITHCKGRTISLFSVMSDKDIHGMIRAASDRFDAWFLADQPTNPRAAAAADVAAALHQEGHSMVSVSKNVEQALQRAQAEMDAEDRLVVFGSFYTVAQALPLLAAAAAGATKLKGRSA